MPPVILDVAIAHRAALLNMEEAAMRNAAQRWLGVEQSLRTATEALALQMANGEEPVTAEQLMLSRRYRDLRVQINDELHRYARWMDNSITDGQRNMATMALEHSATAIQTVAMESQITVPWNRLPVAATNEMIGIAGNGSPLLDVLNDATAGAGDAWAQRLVSGIALGKNPIEVARQAIRAGLGTSFTRMQATSRTEMLRVYRNTSLLSYENSRVVKSYRRLSARDSRVCAACLMSDGQQFDISDGFDAHPQCVVGGTVVSSPTILATSKRWYAGEVIEIRTLRGNVLTVTPNHPILTDKGWVAANLLKECDNVISSLDGQGTISAVNPNDYSRPTVIEDVLEAFARTGGMIPVTQSSAMFHGDGTEGRELLIGYSSADYKSHGLLERLMQDAPQALTKEQYGLGTFHRILPEHHTGHTNHYRGRRLRANQSALQQHLNRLPAFDGLPLGVCYDCADRIRAQFDGDSLRLPRTPIGPVAFLGESARGDFAYSDDSIQDGFAAQLQSWGADAHSTYRKDLTWNISQGEIGTQSIYSYIDYTTAIGITQHDTVTSVSRRGFSGYVYNLETSTGWYVANGIVTHNCRCTLIPVLANVPPVVFQTGKEWFAAQPEGTQLAILGRGRYDLWRAGHATLDDMVSRDWSDTWGGALRVTRVRDLR